MLNRCIDALGTSTGTSNVLERTASFLVELLETMFDIFICIHFAEKLMGEESNWKWQNQVVSHIVKS